jgi:hypothetical protein
MGSDRAREIADQVDTLNAELIQVVRGCSEEQWQTLCNDEGDGRSVGVIAHHVAHGHANTLDWLETALTGSEVTATLDQINADNAEHAATYHDVARAATIALLESRCRELCDRIAELGDEELDRRAFHRGAGRELTVEDFGRLGRRHVAGHLATIRKTLDLD